MALNLDALLRIKADVQGENNIRKLGNSLQGVTGQAKNLQAAVGGLAGGFGVLTGALTALAAGGALKGVADAFAGYQADILALEKGLRNLGNGAPASLEPLKKLASDLGEQTLFNEEDFNKGFALLTSFGNIGVKQYERVARAASDVAQISGTDVQQVLLQLAKALNAPSQGVSALARSGIQFTEAQKDLIKQLEKTGQVAKAQELIFKELEKQYGGASLAAATGLAGSFDTLGEKVFDVQKALGPLIEDALTPLIATLTQAADVTGNQLLPAINSLPDPVKAFAAAIVGLTGGFVALKLALQGVLAISTSAAFASLLAAGPWIALAAGITAAAVALGSYRTESQKLTQSLGGAARGGGAADLARARNRIVELQQQISLAERQQQQQAGGAGGGGGRGGQRSAAGTGLNSLRAELARLKQDVAAGEAASTRVPPALAGGGADSAAAAAAATSASKKKTDAEREAEKAAKDYNTALTRGADLADDLKRRIRDVNLATQGLGETAREAIDREYQEALNNVTDEGEKLKQKILELRELSGNRLLFEGLANAEGTGLAQQLLNALGQQAEIDRIIKLGEVQAAEAQQAAAEAIEGFDFGVGGGFAAGLADSVDQARESLKELAAPLNVIRSSAESVGRAFSEAFRGVISGSVSAKDALANFFQATADAFLDLASQIITQLITITILESLSKIFSAGSGLTGAGALGSSGLTDISGTPVSGAALGLGSIGTPGSTAAFSGFRASFATGGVVTRPTLALIGEGGEPEAIIPFSKMDAAMANWADGQRGPGLVGPTVSSTTNNYSNSMENMIPFSKVSSAMVAAAGGGQMGGGMNGSSLSTTNSYSNSYGASIPFTKSTETLVAERSERETISALNNPKPIDVRFESQMINGVEYVTAEQHQKGMAQAAERGRSLALTALQNSVKTRKRVGMA